MVKSVPDTTRQQYHDTLGDLKKPNALRLILAYATDVIVHTCEAAPSPIDLAHVTDVTAHFLLLFSHFFASGHEAMAGQSCHSIDKH